MSVELYILTGASRGLGRAMAEQLLAPSHTLLTISRKPDRSLDAAAAASGARIEQWALDVALDVGVAARLEAWLHRHTGAGFTTATLINNAALVGRVGPIESMAAEMLAAVVRVDLEAPMLLTAAFLRATRPWPTRRRVLNISSGAGRRTLSGSAAYCAAKAGLDHFARVVAEDEVLLPNPAGIVSLAPGVIDTDMQTDLRSAAPEGFPGQAQFVAMKATGQLATAKEAAARCLAYLARPDFGTHPVADVRDV